MSIDNACPEIRLWQQYRQNEPMVNYFNFLQSYWQGKYFDKLQGVYDVALSAMDTTTEYIQFYAKYILGIERPIDITASSRYDSGYKYDKGVPYDYSVNAGVIKAADFQRMLFCIINWTQHSWNLEFLYWMVHTFTLLNYSDIAIIQSGTDYDTFNITLPTTDTVKLFKSLLQNYTNYWNIPMGIKLNIILI